MSFSFSILAEKPGPEVVGSSSSSSSSPTAATMQQSTRTEMRPVKYHYADSFWCTYLISVFAASIAETVTYPLDLTKTRLQIQGEAAAVSGAIKKVSPHVVEGSECIMQVRTLEIESHC